MCIYVLHGMVWRRALLEEEAHRDAANADAKVAATGSEKKSTSSASKSFFSRSAKK